MTDDQKRITELEKQVKELQGVVRPGASPVLWVALGVAFLLYVWCVRQLPFPGDPSASERFWIGAGVLCVTVFICGGALELVELAFKALVESALALLLLFNAVAGVLLVVLAPDLEPMVASLERVQDEHARGLVFFIGAVALFVLDVGVLLVLFPLAKVAGTDLGK